MSRDLQQWASWRGLRQGSWCLNACAELVVGVNRLRYLRRVTGGKRGGWVGIDACSSGGGGGGGEAWEQFLTKSWRLKADS